MSFPSVAKMLEAAAASGRSLADTIIYSDLAESGLSYEESRVQMRHLWSVMKETSAGYDPSDRSNSGLSGGDAEKVRRAAASGILIGDSFFNEVIEEALKTAECNACMKRIVASPTAGSCGVIPAVLIPLARQASRMPADDLQTDGSAVVNAFEERICDALYVAAGFGQVVAVRASVSGAEGGCQAEVGTASAMAAAALVCLRGGSDDRCAHAFAMALGNMLGLVCDPVAGLVEVPCVKRNVIGAVNAVSAANMALAGVDCKIPADEVIDAMGEIGHVMAVELRETGIGGMAGTPTGQKIAEEILKNRQQ